jgi:hypothetical protein
MDPPFSSAIAPSAASRQPVWRGVLTGLVPLALLVLVMGTAVGVTVAVRLLLAGQGFLIEQQVVVPVLTGGEALAAIVYAVACMWALRRAGRLLRSGAAAAATAALWTLAMSALIVLLPVLLALVIPQHPAPVL